MRPRHPRASALPRHWLMTDERLGDALPMIVAALPRNSGIVFRHYATPARERRVLFAQIRRIARARGHVLLVAEPWLHGADGIHGRLVRGGERIATRPVHSRRELIAAGRAGVDAVFVSPVFPTRSHPGGHVLGRARFGLLVRDSRVPVIALGGMNTARARGMAGFGIAGWAAIDAWTALRRD